MTDKAVQELLPCPLCGNQAKLCNMAGWEVVCKCGINLCLDKPDKGPLIAAWNTRAALKAQPALPTPGYGPIEVVGDLVRNLLALDQLAPIYAAFHVDYQGKRACRTRPVWVSLERVVDGKWVDSARKDVPYSIVVWAKPQADEKAQPAPIEAQGEVNWPAIVKEKDRQIIAAGKTIFELRCHIAAQGEDSARLDACPFCGAARNHSSATQYGTTLFILCHKCKARGPAVGYKLAGQEGAISAWNQRAAPQPREQS